MNLKIVASLLMMFGGLLMLATVVSKFDLDIPIVDVKQAGAWVIVVEETESRSIETAKIFNAADFWKSLESRSLKWRWYDPQSPNAEQYKNDLTNIDLPAILIQTKEGKVIAKQSLPKTLDEVDAVIKKATGL
jgi:hypothetical protein